MTLDNEVIKSALSEAIRKREMEIKRLIGELERIERVEREQEVAMRQAMEDMKNV